MAQEPIGRVLAIALRCPDKSQMKEVSEATATPDTGLVGDIAARAERGVTLIASGQWKEVQRELRVDLPWHTRRANVLIDAKTLGHLIGAEIKVGEVILRVEGETRPCDLMDRLHFGLKTALKPDCRGGVHGRILQPGTIRVGDAVTISGD